MKETEQFSVGGYAFVLEKDAAAALQSYISRLEAHYLAQEGGKEIMEGIEERVAELLLEKCGQGGVVSLVHVQEVINIVGKPESIEADDPAPEAPAQGKKLYRDLENKRLGGVCSGLSAYLNVDVAWLRLAFVVLTAIFFLTDWDWIMTVPFIYGILWVAMPAARTARERWAMKGDGGTADDIRRNVQAGIREMGDAAREVGKSSAVKGGAKILLMVIGISLLVIGTSGLASVSALTLGGGHLMGIPYMSWLEQLSTEAPGLYALVTQPWVIVLLVAAVVLPFIGILYGGIQMIFGFKSPSWRPGLVIFVLWLMVVVTLAVVFCIGAVHWDALPAVMDWDWDLDLDDIVDI